MSINETCFLNVCSVQPTQEHYTLGAKAFNEYTKILGVDVGSFSVESLYKDAGDGTYHMKLFSSAGVGGRFNVSVQWKVDSNGRPANATWKGYKEVSRVIQTQGSADGSVWVGVGGVGLMVVGGGLALTGILSEVGVPMIAVGAGMTITGCGDPGTNITIQTTPEDFKADGKVADDEGGESICEIVDPNLSAAIRDALGKGPDDDITLDDALSLTSLEANYIDISNLEGVECFTNLTILELIDNQISDIKPLADLTSLSYLDLRSNQISNLLPLAELTNLANLYLSSNQISNLSPLAKLTSLTKLKLGFNQISNLSPLAGLIYLPNLDLVDNQISNLSPLAKLTSLSDLNLALNQISDITPLIKNTGLGDGDFVYIKNNPNIPASQIAALRAKGVYVAWQ